MIAMHGSRGCLASLNVFGIRQCGRQAGKDWGVTLAPSFHTSSLLAACRFDFSPNCFGVPDVDPALFVISQAFEMFINIVASAGSNPAVPIEIYVTVHIGSLYWMFITGLVSGVFWSSEQAAGSGKQEAGSEKREAGSEKREAGSEKREGGVQRRRFAERRDPVCCAAEGLIRSFVQAKPPRPRTRFERE